jgi:hypothetical protein
VKLRLTLILACVLVSLLTLGGQAQSKQDPIKLDAEQTASYRKLLLIATNSKLALQNLELQIELALTELSAEWSKDKTINPRARQFLSDQSLAQLAKAREAEQQAQDKAFAFLAALGVAENELLNYELREVAGKFELHRRGAPPVPTTALKKEGEK